MLLKLSSPIFLLLSVVNAYFHVPHLRSRLPFKAGMATATRNNNTLIMFGGENTTNSYTNELYQLSQVSDTFDWQILQQNNPPPGTLYGQAVITNNGNDMYLLGGMTNATNNLNVPLQNYHFSFASKTWAASVNNNATIFNTTVLPRNRKLFSATYDNQNKVYIYGGSVSNNETFGDFYSLDLTTQQYTALPNPPILRYGHTGSLLSDGRIVFIGGVYQANSSSATDLAPMNVVYVFDPRSNQWGVEKVSLSGTVIPSSRTSHSAVVTSDDRIIIFGGDNGRIQRSRLHLNAIAILDTKNWTWSIPLVNGIPPSRRSYASAGLLNGHLTIAFGFGLNTYYSDINVMDTSTNKWIQSFTPTEEANSGVSDGKIAGVTVACVALLIIILFLLWKFQGYVRWFFKRVHRNIWKPRAGEPLWAETSRIIFQIFLLFIFCVFLAFVVRQAIESPNITQTFQETLDAVEVPDIRFCFDGFPQFPETDLRTLGITCFTENGYTCTHLIQQLDMSVLQPVYPDNLGLVNCYLFRAPSDLVLISTPGVGNGTKLIFTMYGDQAFIYGRIRVAVYPKQMDPNVATYNIIDSIPSSMPEHAILDWQYLERSDFQRSNSFTVQPFTYSSLTYNIVDNQYLQKVGWNYVGFLPSTNSTPGVETFFRQGSPRPNYPSLHTDLGTIVVSPATFEKIVRREVKMYTLINALGFVGGIFGLLVAFQACLFGVRPKSPWGVVQRWSVGNMKRSLYQSLRSKFEISKSGVPLIHPVHHQFGATDDNNLDEEGIEIQRSNCLEERVQMLEMLMKSYYVDDEVFKSLDDAYKAEGVSRTEDGQGYLPGNVNNISKMFPFGSPANVPSSERITADAFTMGSTRKPNPRYHSLNRHDTDRSSISDIPLTETRNRR